jgi:hypothetical protein
MSVGLCVLSRFKWVELSKHAYQIGRSIYLDFYLLN